MLKTVVLHNIFGENRDTINFLDYLMKWQHLFEKEIFETL